MLRWEIVVDGWMPDGRLSLNGRRRTHPLRVAGLTTDAKLVLSGFILAGPAFPVPRIDPAHVAITFVYPTRRRRDPDGLAGMAKPILDTLVDFGLLVDDDCEHISLTVAAEVERGVTATRIAVEERRKAT